MMDGFADKIAAMIDRIGRDAVARTVTNSGSAFDPVQANVDVAVKLVSFNFRANEIDGSIIQKNDKDFVLSSAVAITKQMKIVDGGVEYHIISLEEVKPGNNVLLYAAQGRA